MVVCLLSFWAFKELTTPKVLMFGQKPSMFKSLLGPLLLVASVAVAWFRHEVEAVFVWVASKTQRLLVAIGSAALIAIEFLLHIFSVPHIEGWWMMLLSAIPFVGVLIHRIRKK